VSEFIAEKIWPGALVERSIFGTDDPRAIWAQVLETCPRHGRVLRVRGQRRR
jgi:hypothetical protein